MKNLDASTQEVIDRLVRLLNTENNSTIRQANLNLVLAQLSEHVRCWCGRPLWISGLCNICDDDD